VSTQQQSVLPSAEMQQKASGAQQSLQGPWNDDSLADFGVSVWASTAIAKCRDRN